MSGYFTVRQANEALPHVKKLYKRVLECKSEISRTEAALAASGSSLTAYIRLKQNLNSAVTRFYESIEKLESSGVVVKSIEDGLMDFPAEKFGEEIWLCWKSGEDEIKFWHEKDSGFGGRKPLEISDESLV